MLLCSMFVIYFLFFVVTVATNGAYSGGDLMERLAAQDRSSYEEAEAADILRKVAGALSHCHSVSFLVSVCVCVCVSLYRVMLSLSARLGEMGCWCFPGIAGCCAWALVACSCLYPAVFSCVNKALDNKSNPRKNPQQQRT